jgi:precorrin-2 dehydrogenase / sirohydrochlorin ferrochelatase
MKRYYPIMLDLHKKHVVVVGGGKVAERKIRGLLDSGAQITMISPEATEPLQELHEQKLITWRKKSFEPEDIKDAFIIVASTNQKEINAAVQQEADKKQLINLVDDPDRSNFHVPSVIRRGRLNIAVSTSGASPILAKKIGREIGQMYDERYEQYVDFLFDCRQKIIKEVTDSTKKKELLSAIVDPAFLDDPNREETFMGLFKEITGE